VAVALFQCSTLMLVESAKDSLSFSVSHYKHLKQPHTVQVSSAQPQNTKKYRIKSMSSSYCIVLLTYCLILLTVFN